jgi:hypothetical protein
MIVINFRACAYSRNLYEVLAEPAYLALFNFLTPGQLRLTPTPGASGRRSLGHHPWPRTRGGFLLLWRQRLA